MLKPATFQIDGDVIRITSGHSRTHSIVVAVSAVVILVLAFIRKYLPEGLIEIPEGEEPWLLYLVGVFGCLSAAFWWSEVTLDLKADQVLIHCRWGLSCRDCRRAISSYDSVTLRSDSDGEVSVYLEKGSRQDWSLETNNDRAIVWGRPYEEARKIAEALAQRLGFQLHDHVSAEIHRQNSCCA